MQMASEEPLVEQNVQDMQDESSDLSDCETAPGKAKRKKIAQKYRPGWSLEWPFIKPSKKGCYYCYCRLCEKDLSIQGGGGNDIKQHITRASHKRCEEIRKLAPNLVEFTKKDHSSSLQNKVMKAELLFTDFLIEHNVPIAASDHSNELFRKMFPDSEISKKYACKRTKTTSLVKFLGETEQNDIVKKLKKTVFCIATDGSNDMNASKLYPILVCYYDNQSHKIVTVHLGLRECMVSSTGKNIFLEIDAELKSHGLSWDQILAFSTDNAAVMVGHRSGVAAFIKEQNPNCYIAGCCCHLLHIAAKSATKSLAVPIEDLLTDVFYYLHKSSKRQQELNSFQEIYNEDTKKVLKHTSTRWLSLTRCLHRLLEIWDPLLVFFRQEADSGKTSNSLGKKQEETQRKSGSDSKKSKESADSGKKKEDNLIKVIMQI